jgi:FkbM family methyltransferase
MNVLHKISNASPFQSFFGKLLRLPLSLIPRNARVRIMRGPLRGYHWIAGSGPHSYWLGFYEHPTQKFFIKTVRPGWVVYDLGAHVGFYSLLGSVLVGEGGCVVAFEPNPRNLHYLKQHIKLNHVKNVIVYEAAVTDVSGSAHFAATTSLSGHLSEGAHDTLTVSAIKLDDLYAEGKLLAPQMIKMDVEGGEVAALRGATHVLSDCRPVILLGTHGLGVLDECSSFLKELNYSVQLAEKPIEGSELRQVIAIPSD